LLYAGLGAGLRTGLLRTWLLGTGSIHFRIRFRLVLFVRLFRLGLLVCYVLIAFVVASGGVGLRNWSVARAGN
jgi:hypothetical protein